MLGLGTGELIIIGIVALLVIGPDRLPFIMRQLGRWYGQIRRTADELRRAFVLEADRQDAAERYKKLVEQRRKAQEEARRRMEESRTDGARPQEVVPPEAESPSEPRAEAGAGPSEGLVPNDIPPDAPAHLMSAFAPASEAPAEVGTDARAGG